MIYNIPIKLFPFADVVFWSELHPEEGGSIIIFSFKTGDDNVRRWTPANFSSKNRVHEYGGGAFIVHGGIVYFSNDEDQRIYAQRAADDQPKPITPDGVGYRYADCEYQNKFKKIFCVREDHSKVGSGERKEPENTIVMIDIETQKQEVVVSDQINIITAAVTSNLCQLTSKAIPFFTSYKDTTTCFVFLRLYQNIRR